VSGVTRHRGFKPKAMVRCVNDEPFRSGDPSGLVLGEEYEIDVCGDLTCGLVGKLLNYQLDRFELVTPAPIHEYQGLALDEAARLALEAETTATLHVAWHPDAIQAAHDALKECRDDAPLDGAATFVIDGQTLAVAVDGLRACGATPDGAP